MDDMVEKVAKAMWARRQFVGKTVALIELADWDDELPSLRDEVRAEARVVLDVIFPPFKPGLAAHHPGDS